MEEIEILTHSIHIHIHIHIHIRTSGLRYNLLDEGLVVVVPREAGGVGKRAGVSGDESETGDSPQRGRGAIYNIYTYMAPEGNCRLGRISTCRLTRLG